MFDTFGEYMFFLLTTPLRKVQKSLNQYHIFFEVTGKLFDDCKQDIFRMRQEAIIATASAVMLDVHGQDRGMIRLRGESIEGFRTRLMMKAIIAEKAGSREGILLALAALGYEKAVIEPYSMKDPTRWAEFIVDLGAGNGQSVRDLAVIYQEILLVKQASSKPAYLLFTDNDPFDDRLILGTDVTSYAELTLNDADELILVRDKEFISPLYAAVVLASYSETVLNSADDPMLTPNRSFDIPLNFSTVATSYKEELLQ